MWIHISHPTKRFQNLRKVFDHFDNQFTSSEINKRPPNLSPAIGKPSFWYYHVEDTLVSFCTRLYSEKCFYHMVHAVFGLLAGAPSARIEASKMDGANLGYSYHLPSGGWNFRVRNALSQCSDIFSEFNKYIAPAYHHDRCERLNVLNFWKMKKCRFFHWACNIICNF